MAPDQSKQFSYSAYQPAVIALTACASIVILGALWVFITLSDLCCCFLTQRHGGHSGKTDNKTSDPGISGSDSPKDTTNQANTNPTRTEVTIEAETSSQNDRQKKTSFFTRKDETKKKNDMTNQEKDASLKDRISLFEKNEQKPVTDITRAKDGTKPKKKKPTSKAFQEFETSGLLIGFGNVPRRPRLSEQTSQENTERAEFVSGDDPVNSPPEHQSQPVLLPGLPSGSRATTTGVTDQNNTRSHSNSLSRLTDDEGIHTMDEEDEFASVARNSEVLKSFRRVPPPKNRSKARRPMRNTLGFRSDLQLPVPGFDFPMALDEEGESDGEEDGTCSHSVESLATPSTDRGTPENDTGTSGHHTGNSSPQAEQLTNPLILPHHITSRRSTPLTIQQTQETIIGGDADFPRRGLSCEVIPEYPTTEKQSFRTSEENILKDILASKSEESFQPVSNRDNLMRKNHDTKVNTKVYPQAARPKAEGLKESTEKERNERSNVLSPTFISTSRVQLTNRYTYAEKYNNQNITDHKQETGVSHTGSNVNNNNGVFMKSVPNKAPTAVARRHSTQDGHSISAQEVSGDKLILTPPRSFQPVSFSRKRESSLTDSTKIENTPRARIQSSRMYQDRSKSCVLGSPKFLRKWDSELSGLDAKRRKEQSQGDPDNDKTDKPDSEVLSVEERKKKFQVKWETAL